jgi:hypothetical protein
MLQTDLYACSANGKVQVPIPSCMEGSLLKALPSQCWSASFNCTASWQAHENHIVLSSAISYSKHSDDPRLITGGNDGSIRVTLLAAHTARRAQSSLTLFVASCGLWPYPSSVTSTSTHYSRDLMVNLQDILDPMVGNFAPEPNELQQYSRPIRHNALCII